jgi:outer membrane protein TolC
LSLDQALAALDQQSPNLAQARSRVAEAKAVVVQARVPLLPTVVVAGGYTRNSDERIIDFSNTPLATMVSGPLVLQPLGVWSASGSVRVPLVVPNAWADWAAARAGAEAAAASAEAARLQLRASLIQAAWITSAAAEIVAASERAVSVAVEHRASAARGVSAGTMAPLSVTKADTEVVRRQSDLAQARANLERGTLAVGIMLGKTTPVRVQLPADSQPDVSAAPEQALGSRPEMAALDAQIRSAQSQVRSAKLRWLPQLSTSGTLFAADVAYPTGKKTGWRLTLDLAWPLYDGGLRSGKGEQAEAVLATARAASEAQRLGIVQEALDARRDIAVARERLHLAEQQKEFAAAAAASAQRTFEAGIASSLDVLDANDKLYQADVALADAHGRLGVAQVAWEKAMGRLR